MKFKIIFVLILFSFLAFGQTDQNHNPIFNSISTGEKPINNSLLISNYYTLKNNIENSQSSVFISEKPTLTEIENAAINLPSDFFILTRNSKMLAMILLQNYPKREFVTVVISTNQQATYSCKLNGDITENRANEIIKEQYDSNAKIENNILFFNNNHFQIISNKEIEESVLTLIKKEELDKIPSSEITLLSKNELKEYILAETKENGQLDFFTEIKGKEYDGIQIKPGVFSTQLSLATYKWGRACWDLGVNTVEDAYTIFSEFKNRELNSREKDYIKMGFNKELENSKP